MKRVNTRLEILEQSIREIVTDRNTHQAIEELEEWHRAMVAKYNSAEEKSKRSREYEEILAIGRSRKRKLYDEFNTKINQAGGRI